MVALFGLVGEFNEEKDKWRLYVEQMKHHLNANGIQIDAEMTPKICKSRPFLME